MRYTAPNRGLIASAAAACASKSADPVFHPGDGRLQGAGLETRRIDRERAGDCARGGGGVAIVERQFRNEHVRGDERRVQRQRALGELPRHRGIGVDHRPAEADIRGRIAAVGLDGRPVRADRVGVLVLFDEQIAPGGLQFGVVAHHRGGVAEEVVRLLHAPERMGRTRSTSRGRAVGGARRAG